MPSVEQIVVYKYKPIVWELIVSVWQASLAVILDEGDGLILHD